MRTSLVLAGRRIGELILFGALPIGWLTAAFVAMATGRGNYLVDFRPVWKAGKSFLSLSSPYPADPTVLTHGVQIAGHIFVYPVMVAAVFAPLSVLPYPLAAAVFVVVSVCAWFAALRLIGVRDWRCYGIAFAMPALTTSVTVGTLTPLLGLGLAAAWRWRDSPFRCGLSLAAVVAAKIFLWPLVLWLLVMRRWVAAGVALVGAVLLTFGPWAAIGFRGIRTYPALLRNLGEIEGPRGFGAAAIIGTGGTLWVATALAVGIFAYICRRSQADEATFATMVLLAIFLSPIVWLHYFALVVPVIAIWRQSLAPAWFVPLACWATPGQDAKDLWRILFAWSVFVLASLVARQDRAADRGLPRGLRTLVPGQRPST